MRKAHTYHALIAWHRCEPEDSGRENCDCSYILIAVGVFAMMSSLNKRTKLIAWHADKSIHQALRLLAAKTGRTHAAILSKAFANELERNGEPIPEALLRDIADNDRNGRRGIPRSQ